MNEPAATSDLDLLELLEKALVHRRPLLESLGPVPALRLFNGFWEGWPDLAVDLYGQSLVIHGYAQNSRINLSAAHTALAFYSQQLSFPITVLLKERASPALEGRRGVLLAGSRLDQKVSEYGIWYSIRLDLHQDTSLYLDTRPLRLWAAQNLDGQLVLNTFAYTGSLGAAALAGGARQVIQTDLSPDYLAVAAQTYRLNGWPASQAGLMDGDFFSIISRLKRQNALFDCVFLDPPIFSQTEKGRVDLNNEFHRLVNKVRPIIGDGGRLVAVNNAVFVSGQAYMEMLTGLAASGYLEIEEIIPAPLDFTGCTNSPSLPLPADPAPFNYSTKIAVLRVKRKDGRTASSL